MLRIINLSQRFTNVLLTREPKLEDQKNDEVESDKSEEEQVAIAKNAPAEEVKTTPSNKNNDD